MSASGLEVFDDTVHKTNLWLKEIMAALAPIGSAPTMRCVRSCTACATA